MYFIINLIPEAKSREVVRVGNGKLYLNQFGSKLKKKKKEKKERKKKKKKKEKKKKTSGGTPLRKLLVLHGWSQSGGEMAKIVGAANPAKLKKAALAKQLKMELNCELVCESAPHVLPATATVVAAPSSAGIASRPSARVGLELTLVLLTAITGTGRTTSSLTMARRSGMCRAM